MGLVPRFAHRVEPTLSAKQASISFVSTASSDVATANALPAAKRRRNQRAAFVGERNSGTGCDNRSSVRRSTQG